jgi:hypothetical protein
MKFAVLLSLCVLAVLGQGACGGESTQDKASTTVCDARSDIRKQVATLKALTPATVSTDVVSNSLRAIGDDVNKIRTAQQDLSGDRKQQVQDATNTFVTRVKTIGMSVAAGGSPKNAAAQLASALDQLANAYQQSLAKIDC